MLQSFNCEPGEMDLYSYHFVHPEFNPVGFNVNKPHTMLEWQCVFFSTNKDAKKIDELFANNFMARVNAHSSGFAEYLKRKHAKGLLIT